MSMVKAVAEVVFLIVAVITAAGSIGSPDPKAGERCVMLAAIFTMASVALLLWPR